MSNPPGLLRRLWRGFRRLHLALYVIFALMMGLGGIVASIFEQYSIMDFDRGLEAMQRRSEAVARGEKPLADGKVREAFKPLDEKARDAATAKGGSSEDVNIELGASGSRWPYLIIVIWLWPLYRHYFSRAAPNLGRVEQRIVDLPVFLFALTALTAVLRYFEKVGLYRDLYGEPDFRTKLTFAAAALLLLAFAGYLNLEVTQLYIRRAIARPFFAEFDPYGLKKGLRVGLTSRYALMIFSLAMAPLALAVYLPVYFNFDLLGQLRAAKTGDTLFYANARVLVPLLLTALVAGIMLCFHLLSILLFRWNVQRPLAALIGRMRGVAKGDFTTKTSVLDSDEIGQLKGHFNLMLDGLQERERIKDTFGRYVSIEIAAKVMQSGKVNLEGEEIEASVLFSDIRNFTPLSESLPPRDLIQFLNAYFAHVTKPIMENGGVINKFIGDAVMAIFSPVFGREDHAAAAVRAARGMREALAEFNRTGGYPPVFAGVGVHSGRLVAGSLGTAERTEYTVLGDTVNVAARIESETKTQGTDILVSDAVLSRLRAEDAIDVPFDSCGLILLKGKSVPLELFRVG